MCLPVYFSTYFSRRYFVMGEISKITTVTVTMMTLITIMSVFFNLVSANFIFQNIKKTHLLSRRQFSNEDGEPCDASSVLYLLVICVLRFDKFQRRLTPTASEEVDKPKERYLLHGILCNAGTTMPRTAPSPNPTAISDGK